MKNQKGSIVIILLVIAVLAIGGGTYFYEKNISRQAPQETFGQQSSQTNTNPDGNQLADQSRGSLIEVLSPEAGTILTAGQTYNITWKSNNVGNQAIFITLLSDKDTQVSSIGEGVPNNGNFSWKVSSSVPKGNYHVVVGTSENMPTGVNTAWGKSGQFAINSNVPAPVVPVIKTISPQTVYITGGSGMSDTVVTVTGTNFSEDKIHLIDSVSGANVTDLSANTPSGNPTNSTYFEMKIPNFIKPGKYSVVVENSRFGLKSNPSTPITITFVSAINANE